MSAISGEPYAARVFARTRARRPRKLVRYILLCDLLALTLAGVAAVAVCGRVSTAVAVAWVGGSVVVAAATLSAYQLYERDRQQIAVSTLDEIRDLLHALNL